MTLKRTTSMKPGTKGLKSGAPMKRTAMKPGSKAMERAAKPMRTRSRNNADPRPKTGEAALCRGQPCYLLIPGVQSHPIDTVVPCHSNSLARGKGMGIKADEKFTVPGCMHCHYTLDQGRDLDKEQRRAIWESAYERWSKDRMAKYGM